MEPNQNWSSHSSSSIPGTSHLVHTEDQKGSKMLQSQEVNTAIKISFKTCGKNVGIKMQTFSRSVATK